VLKSEVKKLIEPHFFENLHEENYKIQTIRALDCLNHNRFDLAFKILYLEMLDKDLQLAEQVYMEHIRAFSLGTFTEPGNEAKSSIARFKSEFVKTFNSIKKSGFDPKKTLIPLSNDGVIANGSHRVASAIILDKNVDCVQLETSTYIYDYKFFYERNVPKTVLDISAIKFVEYSERIYIACVWPSAVGHEVEVEETIPNIVYAKNISLTPIGAHNLISHIYSGESWIGGARNNFKGSRGKLVECFKTFEPVKFFAFQATNLAEAKIVKDSIRKIFGLGKHSVHITDTKEEAVRLARVVFNDNCVHFLNNAKPNKYPSTMQQLGKFNDFLASNQISPEDVVLDTGMVLSAYGVREAGDVDYLSNNTKQDLVEHIGINCHDDELVHYRLKKSSLIYNQKFFFYFNGFKFLSFPSVYKMKINRDDEKDRNDCRLMEALIDDDFFKCFINKVKQSLYYQRIKLRYRLKCLLKRLGLYPVAHFFYSACKKTISNFR
jgi:hypothetical protein